MPQDGHENMTVNGWPANGGLTNTPSMSPLTVSPCWGMISLSNQRLCKFALQNGLNFIFVCKRDSHATLYERLAFWQATDAIKAL